MTRRRRGGPEVVLVAVLAIGLVIFGGSCHEIFKGARLYLAAERVAGEVVDAGPTRRGGFLPFVRAMSDGREPNGDKIYRIAPK